MLPVKGGLEVRNRTERICYESGSVTQFFKCITGQTSRLQLNCREGSGVLFIVHPHASETVAPLEADSRSPCNQRKSRSGTCLRTIAH